MVFFYWQILMSIQISKTVMFSYFYNISLEARGVHQKAFSLVGLLLLLLLLLMLLLLLLYSDPPKFIIYTKALGTVQMIIFSFTFHVPLPSLSSEQ